MRHVPASGAKVSPVRLVCWRLAAICTAIALVVLCIQVDENPATRDHLWILVGMIGSSLAIEIAYRRFTGRTIHPPRPVARREG